MVEHIDEQQPPSVVTSDTDNATMFHPSEAPPHLREQYERFRAYNTGLWNGPFRENKQAMHRQDNLHRYDAIASSLDLTEYQKQRGRAALDDVALGKVGLNIDLFIFALCILVVNRDAEGTRYWPHTDKMDNDPAFETMARELNFPFSKQLSAVMKAKRLTNL